jgi:glutaminyl-peptide cyclotransferase
MRWSIVTAVTIGAFAACLGAALMSKSGQQSRGGGDRSSSSTVAQGSPIDRSRPLPLTPVRAPALLGEVAFEHARQIVSFGPRNPGGPNEPVGPNETGGQSRPATPGWSKQLDYIQRTLEGLGLTVERDTWTDRKELITFTNLSARIPGRRPERILLACHHDTKCMQGHAEPERNFHFVGANDGASGVALLLALAPVLQAAAREATIELVFFDGEESLDWAWNEGARALFGSKRYVKQHRDALVLGEEPRIEAMILLDMVGRTDLHIQEELYSTARLRRILWSAAVATGHERHFFQKSEAAADDHKPFLDVGIPAVDLIDLTGNPHWHKPSDTLENMAPASLQIVADVVLTMLPAVEAEYLVEKR